MLIARLSSRRCNVARRVSRARSITVANVDYNPLVDIRVIPRVSPRSPRLMTAFKTTFLAVYGRQHTCKPILLSPRLELIILIN